MKGRPNCYAAILTIFKPKVVKPRKGSKAYKRKSKHVRKNDARLD